MIKNFKKNRLVVNTALHDDVYLVEFPKSGITWLSFLIGNINLTLSKLNINMTFYNQHQFVIDVHQMRANSVKENITNIPPYRFIKSHDSYNMAYLFVIYLMRNPFDVMTSYFRFMNYLGYDKSFSTFIRDEKYGVKAWKNHINSWFEIKDDAQSFIFLKYENLIKNTKDELRKIYLNLGMNIDDSTLDKAISESSFANMKKSEELYRSSNSRYKMVFIRKGKVNIKEEIMDTDSFTYIKNLTKDILAKYYPEYLEGKLYD